MKHFRDIWEFFSGGGFSFKPQKGGKNFLLENSAVFKDFDVILRLVIDFFV